jgi:hypothetical protein
MNGLRIGLAALGAFVAYFALGGLLFGALPAMRNEFRKFPSVYRPQEGQMAHMPAGMAAMFIAILALATLYATLNRGTSNVRSGAIFGALIGIYSVGSFVVHNYVNLNIGLKLTIQQGLAYFVQWLVVGVVIGAIYRPA